MQDLFATFGEVDYLDRIEAAGFNRLPAPYLNGSMWQLQYFHKTNAIGGWCAAFDSHSGRQLLLPSAG